MSREYNEEEKKELELTKEEQKAYNDYIDQQANAKKKKKSKRKQAKKARKRNK